jgi:glutathione S-transferase
MPSEQITLYAMNACYRPRVTPVRVILYYGQWNDYKDIDVTAEQFQQLREQFALRQLPGLEIKEEGKKTLYLSQTTAIMRYLGRKCGLVPEDEQDQAICDMIGQGIDDIANIIVRQVFLRYQGGATELESEQFKFTAEGLGHRVGKVFGHVLDKNGTGYLVGSKLTWVDLYLAELVDKLALFSRKPDIFKQFPSVHKHHQMVYALPQLKKYNETVPECYWLTH